MEEKYMVNDILENFKSSIKDFEGAILECSNLELRQTMQNLRNSQESFQYELYRLAESKGYYISAEKAKQDEIDKVRNEFI